MERARAIDALEARLGVKLLLILAYIVCGSFALKHARSRAGRAAAFVLALGCIGSVALIATAHDAAAPWSLLSSAWR